MVVRAAVPFRDRSEPANHYRQLSPLKKVHVLQQVSQLEDLWNKGPVRSELIF